MSQKMRLTLYVTGQTVKAEQAMANLRRLCEEEFEGQCELDLVDVLEQPDRAEDARILATPTLIKEFPPPQRRLIGDLSDRQQVLKALRWSDSSILDKHEKGFAQ